MKNIHPTRLLIKTILIFLAANLIFAWWDPPIERLSLYNHLFPGRTRFPYGLGDRTVSISDIDALFASHEISAPKEKNEFRIVVLGDSSIWGDLLESQQTAFAALNAEALQCGGKEVKFYNLGFPHLSAMKDLIILERALDFEPDAIIWSFTLRTVLQKPPNPFLKENAEYIYALAQKYPHLPYPHEELDYRERTFYEKTIIGRRSDLARLFKLQVLGAVWAARGTDTGTTYYPPGTSAPQEPLDLNDLEADLSYREFTGPSNELLDWLWLEYLDVGAEIAGDIPILFLNQPMFIANGENSALHYNEAYPRWAYDQYHDFIITDNAAKERAFLDLWDAIDPAYFTGATFHLSPAGEQIKADLIWEGIQGQFCTNKK